MRRVVTGLVAAVLLVATAACGDDDGGDGAASDRPLVIVTTSILGDVVERTVGDIADVEVLIADGAEIHDAAPSARQRARMAEADLVVAVGLGLEDGYEDVLRAAADDGVAVLWAGLRMEYRPVGWWQSADGEDPPDLSTPDPHVWLSANRLAELPALVVEALLAARPELDAGALEAASVREFESLLALDREVAEVLAAVPEDRRLLVTDHAVLGYLAHDHGFTVVGSIVPSLGTHAEPSAGDLAALADAARSAGVRVVFTEVTGSDDLARSLADEIGEDVAVVPLRLESIGDASGWAEVLLANAHAIADALNAPDGGP